MNAEIYFLEKNGRYRIIHMSGEYYILDMDKFLCLIFIPPLLWLLPQEVYKVKAEIVEELRAPASYSKNPSWAVLGGLIGTSSVLSLLLGPVLNRTIGMTGFANVFLLVLLTTVIVFLRLYLRKSLQRKIYKTIALEAVETKAIRIWPRYFSQYIKPFIFVSYMGMLVFASGYLFIVTSIYVSVLGLIVFLPFLLISNLLFIDPRPEKKNSYRVSVRN